MANYYYLDLNRRQQGPVPADALKSYGVTAQTLVYAQGMNSWLPACQVEELKQDFDGAVPPPPGGAPMMQQNETPPSSNMVWAILTTLFCCLPFGIVSIVYASKVDSHWYANQRDAARAASKSASNWALAAAITGGVIIAAYIILVALGIYSHRYYY